MKQEKVKTGAQRGVMEEKYGDFYRSGEFYEISCGILLPKDYRVLDEAHPDIAKAAQKRRRVKRERRRASCAKYGGAQTHRASLESEPWADCSLSITSASDEGGDLHIQKAIWTGVSESHGKTRPWNTNRLETCGRYFQQRAKQGVAQSTPCSSGDGMGKDTEKRGMEAEPSIAN